MKNIVYIFFIVAAVQIAGCKKQEPTDALPFLNNMKLFNDNLINPAAGYDRIVAGNDRLFMTYGHGNTNLNPERACIQILVTDNEGGLVKHFSLATGIVLNALLPQNDGTFIVATSHFLYDPNSHITFYHYDRDGEFISGDSVALPAACTIYSVSSSPHGNILVCAGDYQAENYFLECNVNGQILWSMQSTLRLNNPCAATDGDFLFIGNNESDNFYLYKTNARGDLLWQKSFKFPFIVEAGIRCAVGNGNYWIAVTDVYSAGSSYSQPPDSYNMLVSAAGDSVSCSLAVQNFYCCYRNSIVKKDDGTVFFLSGNPEVPVGGMLSILTGAAGSQYFQVDGSVNIMKQGSVQNQMIDLFDAACKLSTGSIACFGLLQNYNAAYYQPCLLIIN